MSLVRHREAVSVKMLHEIANSVITTNVDVNQHSHHFTDYDRCCCIGKATIDQFSFSLTSSVLDHQIRGNEHVARVQHV